MWAGDTLGNSSWGTYKKQSPSLKRDNQGGTKYERLRHGVLKAIDDSPKKMKSLVYELDGEKSYITREPLTGSTNGRGISHIMGTDALEDMYMGGCVDKITAAFNIFSDHHLVAADFALQIQDVSLDTERQPIVKYKWGKIANIKMDCTTEEDGNGNIECTLRPKQDTPHTEQWQNNMDLYKELQKKMAKEPEMIAKSHTFLLLIKDLQKDLKEASSHLTPKQQQDGVLIERLPTYKKQL